MFKTNEMVPSYKLSYNYGEVLENRRIFNPFLDLIGSKYKIDIKLQQRGVGDYIEGVCTERAAEVYGIDYIERTSVKSVEDFALHYDDCIHLVDIKTHDVNKTFCMPNLTAISKIKEIYRSVGLKLHYLIIDYSLHNGELEILNVRDCMPHNISWKNLAVANLGNGQLQIKNMNKFEVNYTNNKKKWLNNFFEEVVKFKYSLAEKILSSIGDWRNAHGKAGV